MKDDVLQAENRILLTKFEFSRCFFSGKKLTMSPFPKISFSPLFLDQSYCSMKRKKDIDLLLANKIDAHLLFIKAAILLKRDG